MRFTLQLKNKLNNKTSNVQIKQVIVKELPYRVVDASKFTYASDDQVPKDVVFNNQKLCIITFATTSIWEEYSIMVTPTLTWDEIHDAVLQIAQSMDFRNPENIKGVCFSCDPVYRVNKASVIDTRQGMPYETLPHKAIIYVSMFKRSHGWYPLAVGWDICDTCGTMESSKVKIKKCSVCLQAKYCSRECQTAAWSTHKLQCCKNVADSS